MKRKNTSQKCIKCGEEKIAEFFYGSPEDMKSFETNHELGKIVLGEDRMYPHSPEWNCNSCGWQWRTTEPFRIGWDEGVVDTSKEHFKITYEDSEQPIALIGKDEVNKIKVQFLVKFCSENRQMIKILLCELDLYFNLLNEENPWNYAKYHCTTAANIYSNVHWGFYKDN